MADYQNDLIVRLKTEVDKAGQAALKEQADVVDKTSAAYDKASKSTDKYGKASQRAGYRIQNASYQIADFFVMLDGGINPVRALSTQLPQLLAGFGAVGAAAGAAAAIGSSVFVAFQKMADSSEAANKKIAELGNTIEGLAVGDSAAFNQFQKAINEADEGLRDLIQAQYKLAGIQAEKSLKATNRELKEFVENIRFIGNRSDYERQSENFGSYVRQEVKAIKDNLNAIGDGTATFIRELIIKLDEGKVGISEFAATLADLQAKELISGGISDELLKLVDDLVKAEKQAQQFKNALTPEDKDAEALLNRINKLFENSASQIDKSQAALSRYNQSIADLQAAFDGNLIDEKKLQKGKEIVEAIFAQSLKPIVFDADFQALLDAREAAQKLVDTLELAQDPGLGITRRAEEIKNAYLAIGRSLSEAEAAAQRYKDLELEKILGVDPVVSYERALADLQSRLVALGADAEQTKQALSNLLDEYLQEVEVTATKRPPINWEEQLDLKGLEAVTADIKDSLQDWGDSLADSIIDALDRGMESFKEFADFIIREIARIALQRMVIEPLVNSLTNLFPGTATTGVSLGEIEQAAGASPNARIDSVSAVPMMGYVSAPALAANSSSQSPVTVNVNNYGNDEVEVEQRKTSRGLEIDVLIKGAVRRGIAQGDFDNVMRSSFGARRLAF